MSDLYLTSFYYYYIPGLEFLNGEGETLYKQYEELGGVDRILNFHTPVVWTWRRRHCVWNDANNIYQKQVGNEK